MQLPNIYSDAVMEETACSAQIIEGDAVFALGAMLDWKYFKPNAWNKLYKRQVIGDIRYPKGKIHEDEFTTYKFIYNARKLVYVDISKYNYDLPERTASPENVSAQIIWMWALLFGNGLISFGNIIWIPLKRK